MSSSEASILDDGSSDCSEVSQPRRRRHKHRRHKHRRASSRRRASDSDASMLDMDDNDAELSAGRDSSLETSRRRSRHGAKRAKKKSKKSKKHKKRSASRASSPSPVSHRRGKRDRSRHGKKRRRSKKSRRRRRYSSSSSSSASSRRSSRSASCSTASRGLEARSSSDDASVSRSPVRRTKKDKHGKVPAKTKKPAKGSKKATAELTPQQAKINAKRPHSAYQLFCKWARIEYQDELKEAVSGASNAEMLSVRSRLLAKKWNACKAAGEHGRWEAEALEARAAHNKMRIEAGLQPMRERSDKKARSGVPKAKSAFDYFCADWREKHAEQTELKGSVLMKHLRELWSELGADEKETYKVRADAANSAHKHLHATAPRKADTASKPSMEKVRRTTAKKAKAKAAARTTLGRRDAACSSEFHMTHNLVSAEDAAEVKAKEATGKREEGEGDGDDDDEPMASPSSSKAKASPSSSKAKASPSSSKAKLSTYFDAAAMDKARSSSSLASAGKAKAKASPARAPAPAPASEDEALSDSSELSPSEGEEEEEGM